MKARIPILFVLFLSLLILFLFSGIGNYFDVKLYHFYSNIEKAKITKKPLVVGISLDTFLKDSIWPWKENWPTYLIEYILDKKVRGIIIGPQLLNKFNLMGKLDKITSFMEKENIYFVFDSKDYIKNLDYKGHLDFLTNSFIKIPIIEEKNGKKYFPIGLQLARKQGRIKLTKKETKFLFFNGRRWVKFPKKGFLYLPYISSKPFIYYKDFDIVLNGFLKSNGYSSDLINDSIFKNNWVFLEAVNKNLTKESTVISSFINGNLKIALSTSFSIYIGLVIFLLLSIFFFSLRKFSFITSFFIGFIISSLLIHYYLFHNFSLWFSYSYTLFFSILAFSEIGIYRYIRRKEKKIKKEETKLARLLKEKEILPASTVKLDGVVLSVTRYRTEKVGGDFYQFLEFPQGELGIIIGWAPGEGLDRVKYIMEVVQGWRNNASIYKDPNKVFQVLNNNLFMHAEDAKYATAIYLLIDSKKQTMKYVNAGHDPLILISNNTREIELLETKEPTPLGIARDIVFPERIIRLNIGSIMIAYSGGISDSLDKEKLELTKVFEPIKKYIDKDPTHLVDEIFNDLLKIIHGKSNEEWSLLLLKVQNGKK
jgi:hypothetical protein